MLFLPTAHVLLLACLAAAPSSPLAASAAGEKPLAQERMEKLLAEGDELIVVALLRRHLDDALPFVDHYLEEGLKLAESGGGREAAMKSYRLGIKFAQLADQAAPGAAFTEYAGNFASWTPAEQKRFRQGQAEYKRGRELLATDSAAAAEHLRLAVNIANSLGDLWGAAMAYAGLAKAELNQGRNDKVDEAARRANEINARIRQRLASIRVVLVWGDSQTESESRGFGTNTFSYAWSQLQDTDPPELRREVMTKFTQSLERNGQAAMARDIRERFEATAAPTAPSPAHPSSQNPASPTGSGAPPNPAGGNATAQPGSAPPRGGANPTPPGRPNSK